MCFVVATVHAVYRYTVMTAHAIAKKTHTKTCRSSQTFFDVQLAIHIYRVTDLRLIAFLVVVLLLLILLLLLHSTTNHSRCLSRLEFLIRLFRDYRTDNINKRTCMDVYMYTRVMCTYQ